MLVFLWPNLFCSSYYSMKWVSWAEAQVTFATTVKMMLLHRGELEQLAWNNWIGIRRLESAFLCMISTLDTLMLLWCPSDWASRLLGMLQLVAMLLVFARLLVVCLIWGRYYFTSSLEITGLFNPFSWALSLLPPEKMNVKALCMYCGFLTFLAGLLFVTC